MRTVYNINGRFLIVSIKEVDSKFIFGLQVVGGGSVIRKKRFFYRSEPNKVLSQVEVKKELSQVEVKKELSQVEVKKELSKINNEGLLVELDNIFPEDISHKNFQKSGDFVHYVTCLAKLITGDQNCSSDFNSITGRLRIIFRDVIIIPSKLTHLSRLGIKIIVNSPHLKCVEKGIDGEFKFIIKSITLSNKGNHDYQLYKKHKLDLLEDNLLSDSL